MYLVVLAEVGVLPVMRTEQAWGLDHIPHFGSEIVQEKVRSFCSRLSMVVATPVIALWTAEIMGISPVRRTGSTE